MLFDAVEKFSHGQIRDAGRLRIADHCESFTSSRSSVDEDGAVVALHERGDDVFGALVEDVYVRRLNAENGVEYELHFLVGFFEIVVRGLLHSLVEERLFLHFGVEDEHPRVDGFDDVASPRVDFQLVGRSNSYANLHVGRR